MKEYSETAGEGMPGGGGGHIEWCRRGRSLSGTGVVATPLTRIRESLKAGSLENKSFLNSHAILHAIPR